MHITARSRLLALATVAAALTLPVSAHAADPAFIKFPTPDLAGDVQDKEVRGAIELRHFQWSLGSGVPDRKATMNDFHFSKSVDRASPGLMVAAADGRVIPSVRVLVRRSGIAQGPSATYLEYCLEHVVVTSDSVTMSPENGPTPLENLSLSVGRFSQRYIPNTTAVPNTPVSAGWNLQQNTLGTMPGRCGE
jgi:type VI secretion system secreted protein Hcp